MLAHVVSCTLDKFKRKYSIPTAVPGASPLSIITEKYMCELRVAVSIACLPAQLFRYDFYIGPRILIYHQRHDSVSIYGFSIQAIRCGSAGSNDENRIQAPDNEQYVSCRGLAMCSHTPRRNVS
jgi:hypothetical protein